MPKVTIEAEPARCHVQIEPVHLTAVVGVGSLLEWERCPIARQILRAQCGAMKTEQILRCLYAQRLRERNALALDDRLYRNGVVVDLGSARA